MKTVYVILITLFLLSCKATCKINNEEGNNTIGIVHLAEDNCPHYILISKGGVELINKKVYPINLEDKFKKKGLKLSFLFTYSKAMSPENCTVDFVVALDSVKAID
jgi:hypothetical protein